MNSPKSTKRPLIFYYIIVLLALLLINYLLMPNLFAPQTVEMDYGTFLSLIRSGQVEQVEIGDTTIAALVSDKSGSTVIYQTGLVDDPELVNRLLDAGVKFGKVTAQEISPIVSLLIGWVLPLAVFVGLGYLMMRTMTKRMGGGMGAMSFGKANAKVYVEAQTGKTFRDVAGQDEAKEALVEVVDFLHNPKRY